MPTQMNGWAMQADEEHIA